MSDESSSLSFPLSIGREFASLTVMPYTVREFALHCGVNEQRVKQWIAANRIPGAVKHGWAWWIPDGSKKPKPIKRHRAKR